jgi:type I restriction enzyme S subunit
VEQKKIVAKLDVVLGKIKEARKLREGAEAAAGSLLTAELHKIFDEGKKKGWDEKELGEVVQVRVERNTQKGLPYVGMEDVQSGGTGKFLGSTQSREVRSTTSFFTKDTLLFGKLRPYLNKVFLPHFNGHCTTEFLPMYPKEKILIREWLFYWITSDEVIERISATGMGARMPRANMKEVTKFKIPLPPVTEQKKIVARLDALSEKIKTLRQAQNETASAFSTLEQSVLHKAFNF